MRAREVKMKLQMDANQNCILGGEKTKTMLWRVSSEMIGVYLWFLRFSNILLKLVQ